ncbi:MAG TPA: hypothetical protein VFN88_00280, partial [Caulobacteraceae bacterium]|nr:hypothetical protein [Caulobacteraceae bacterium]
MTRAARRLTIAIAVAALIAGAGGPALAKKKPAPAAAAPAPIAEIQAALDEQRLQDAGRLIERSSLAGSRDPMLAVLAGELSLARGRYDDALKIFKEAGGSAAVKARVTQDRGLALSMLGRSDEAFPMLKQAVMEDPSAWRAWNALGGEYDRRRDWANAEDAYTKALGASKGAAIVLNN